MTQAHAAYSVKSWDRKPWGSTPAPAIIDTRLARVEMIHVYEGDIEGEGTIQYLFAHNGDGKAI